jgi:hypothetical protein
MGNKISEKFVLTNEGSLYFRKKRGLTPLGFGGDSRLPLVGDSPLGVAVLTTPIKWQKIKKILRSRTNDG